jgi:uncharacterized protein YbbC (DUF1343 family)
MPTVLSGLDVLVQENFKRLKGQRVGVLCHQASVDRRLIHILPLLKKANIRVTTLFAPEHGLWGTAQDQIEIPDTEAISLYGQNRAPKAEQLAHIDVLLCDLQDVGSRYYTFIWTMALAMQVCAAAGKTFMVVDRPNPLGGIVLSGPVLDLNFASFVGLYAVPIQHGMTIGEMAHWVNETYAIGAGLEVVAMKGWKRRMTFDQTGLPWVPPSPNMPTLDTAIVYPGGCLIEGTDLSEGRGTTRPFEWIGAPFIQPDALAERLNSRKLPGTFFRPCYFEPTFHKFQGQRCGGVQIHVTDRSRFRPVLSYLHLIAVIHDLYPQFSWRKPPYEYESEKWPIDILCGTDRLRLAIEQAKDIGQSLKKEEASLVAFRRERSPFLLYN